MLAIAPAANIRPQLDDMGAFLGHHFGDGLVYLTGACDRPLLAQAMERGLVSDEGYLTKAGYQYWRRTDR
jgi:hypothetical protein